MYKQQLGQYFTINNPFKLKPFSEWFNLIPDNLKKNIIEPFAGNKNIVHFFSNFAIKWHCYDIDTNLKGVIHQDTIEHFPQVSQVAITNPPYLAKNSAKRKKFEYNYLEYDNLYKKCLEVLLNNCQYVAVIIPESFITANLFHNRLYAVISLTCKMFNDTEYPVCLAMFVPEITDDFKIYRMNEFLGFYNELKPKKKIKEIKWKFNDSKGSIGIICIDNLKEPSIKFIEGKQIPSKKIKPSSRSLTRVSGLPNNIDLNIFLDKCNKNLKVYRKKTSDVFLTSFKGLRKDGFYRRRLDFKNARFLMNISC